MKLLYFIRVIALSVEAFVLACSAYIWMRHLSILQFITSAASPADDSFHYLAILPIAMFVWIFKEIKQLVFQDERSKTVLLGWPEYWKLKIHLVSAAIFALIFSAISIASWLIRSGVNPELSLLLLATGLIGQLIVAASVYLAGFRLQELLATLPND